MLAKIKEIVNKHQAEIILFVGVILISLLSFLMGYLIAKQQEKQPLQIQESI